MTIRAQVVRTCDIFVMPMMFGPVSILRPTAEAEARIFLDCTPDTAFRITMDDGQNFRAGRRRMANPLGRGNTAYIDYEIYRDSAYRQRWGQTLASSATGITPASGRVTLTAYGVASGRRSISSEYQDIVTVTVTF